MSPWRRPISLRLLAGLLIVALAWALLPSRPQAHEGATGEGTGMALVQAFGDGHGHEAGLGVPCGPQAACAPTLLLHQVATPAFVAPWRPLRVRAWDDRRTHLHRLAHEPPPPRLPA